MSEPYERLKQARLKAGYKTATDAARAFGWREVTYGSHENGTRGLRKDIAAQYGRAFRVTPEWLLYARDKPKEKPREIVGTVALVGHVGAGAQAYFENAGELDRVTAPEGSTEDTVAVEIRGDSLGALFDRWLVFYDDVRRPVTSDLIGKLCVVGLEDGRVLIKKIQRSRARGLLHLISQTEPPILDVAVEWAAKVKNMTPR